jgi:MSHA biogenesis protein MshL
MISLSNRDCNMQKIYDSLLTFCTCVLLIGFLSACNNQQEKTLMAEQEMDAVVANETAKKNPTANDLSETLLNEPDDSEKYSATVERFDVSVHNVAAKDFFLGLVNGTGVNIVVHPEVSGTLTLDLKKVSLEEVLRVTRDIYGYEFKKDYNIYTIYPNEMRTQVFQINYLDVQRVGVSDTSVMIGRGQSSGNNSAGGSRSGGQSDPGDTANLLGMIESNDKNSKNSGQGLTPGARVQTLNTTDFWASLEQTVTSIIGGKIEDRSVVVSPQAGMVVVKAFPHELSSVREFLEKSELTIKRQVILEAKILEVRLSEGFEAGINWGQISGQVTQAKNLADGFPLNTDGTAPVNEFRPITDNYISVDSTGKFNTASVGSREAIGSTFASLFQITDITKLVSLLETQGSVQVLSSPRVSTVNNQKAVIRVGSDEYFITGISNNTTTNSSATTSTPNIELSPFFSGISLDVTPQIAENGEVILHIHPVVSEVTDQLKVFTVGDENFSLPLALRGVRESDSIVKAANGQVIVLGGLMTESNNNQDGKRPLLGDVPILNSLFKTKNKSKSKTELVILLKPTVVDDQVWKDQLKESQSKMKAIGDAYRKQ